MDFSVCSYEFHWDLMVYKSLKLYDFYHSSLESCNLIIGSVFFQNGFYFDKTIITFVH